MHKSDVENTQLHRTACDIDALATFIFGHLDVSRFCPLLFFFVHVEYTPLNFTNLEITEQDPFNIRHCCPEQRRAHSVQLLHGHVLFFGNLIPVPLHVRLDYLNFSFAKILWNSCVFAFLLKMNRNVPQQTFTAITNPGPQKSLSGLALQIDFATKLVRHVSQCSRVLFLCVKTINRSEINQKK